MKAANRRSVLAGIAAGLAPSSGGAAATPVSVSSPDAELIALCSQFDALERRWLGFFEAIEDDDEREAVQDPIVEEQDALLPRIYELPPSTREGAIALAQSLALWDAELLKVTPGDYTNKVLLVTLVRGLIGGAAPQG